MTGGAGTDFANSTLWSGWLRVQQFGKKEDKKRFCLLKTDRTLLAYKDVSHAGSVKARDMMSSTPLTRPVHD